MAITLGTRGRRRTWSRWSKRVRLVQIQTLKPTSEPHTRLGMIPRPDCKCSHDHGCVQGVRGLVQRCMWHSRQEGSWSFAHSRIPMSQRFPPLCSCNSHTDILLLSRRVRNIVLPFCTSFFRSQGCRRSQKVGRKGACAPDAVPNIRAIRCTFVSINHCESVIFHLALSALPVHRCRLPRCCR